MTATVEEKKTGSGAGSGGRIARVIGPVVDVEFPVDSMPEMYNKLEVELTLGGETVTLPLEVAQHIGDGMVRAISLKPTDGLVRGAQVTDTGSAISVPVGDVVTGHVWNALGECLDEPGYGADAVLSAVNERTRLVAICSPRCTAAPTATPCFCGSSLALTWSITGTRRPSLATCASRSSASRDRCTDRSAHACRRCTTHTSSERRNATPTPRPVVTRPRHARSYFFQSSPTSVRMAPAASRRRPNRAWK